MPPDDEAPLAPKSAANLKLVPFSKPKAGSPPEDIGFSVVQITVKTDDTNQVLDFLLAHVEELPPTVPNLLSLIWVAVRTMLQDLPPESVGLTAHAMVERALAWVPRNERPPG